MNKAILIGRITKDIEIRKTSSDISTCQFTIAVNRNYKNSKSEYETDFINCIAFRNTADFIGNYFKKGNQVCIEGRIQTRNYEDKNKIKHYVTEILVENIMLLEKKEKTEVEDNLDLEDKVMIDELSKNKKTNYDSKEIQLDDADLPF